MMHTFQDPMKKLVKRNIFTYESYNMGAQKKASLVAYTKSHNPSNVNPIPNAPPLTSAIIGFRHYTKAF